MDPRILATGGVRASPPVDTDPQLPDLSNQSPQYQDRDLLGEDAALNGAASALLSAAELGALSLVARTLGAAERFEEARLADGFAPVLQSPERVEYHAAYHALMARSMAEGLHAPEPAGDALAAYTRAARLHLVAQIESGHLASPILSHAAPAALSGQPDLEAAWLPLLRRRGYDTSDRPFVLKSAVTVGMATTERQGGSDLRTNTLRAERGDGGFVLSGEKSFVSAPMSDAFVVTAQARGGPTAFLMPRFRPDDSRNGIRIRALHRTLGHRSNAAAEIELERAFAFRIGEEGRGVATVLRMAAAVRLDCAIVSAGLMRACLARAVHHARSRRAYGSALVDQPAMRAALADLALEVEGATALVMRLALAVDRSARDAGEEALVRFGIPAAKYLVCKLGPQVAAEAMECFGGAGYLEASGMPRLVRDMPAAALWEGPGSVVALDVRRAAERDPDTARELLAALGEVARGLPGVAAAVSTVIADLSDSEGEGRARRAAELLGRMIAVAALAELAPRPVVEAYARLRLAGREYGTYGASGALLPEALLIERAMQA
jgi:putative acyl-CoA dehydrogenase